MLNALWRRLAIQENKPKFEYVTTHERLNRLFYSNQYKVRYVNVLKDDTHQNAAEALDLKLNVIIAFFVTRYPRMELYKGMEFVGQERLLYVDTDCLNALDSTSWPSLPIG